MPGLNATDFVKKLAADTEFRSQVGILPDMSLGEFRDKAGAAGFSYTPEEILAAVGSQQDGALSDEALENVSGGYSGAGLAGNNPLNKLIISVKPITLL